MRMHSHRHHHHHLRRHSHKRKDAAHDNERRISNTTTLNARLMETYRLIKARYKHLIAEHDMDLRHMTHRRRQSHHRTAQLVTPLVMSWHPLVMANNSHYHNRQAHSNLNLRMAEDSTESVVVDRPPLKRRRGRPSKHDVRFKRGMSEVDRIATSANSASAPYWTPPSDEGVLSSSSIISKNTRGSGSHSRGADKDDHPPPYKADKMGVGTMRHNSPSWLIRLSHDANDMLDDTGIDKDDTIVRIAWCLTNVTTHSDDDYSRIMRLPRTTTKKMYNEEQPLEGCVIFRRGDKQAYMNRARSMARHVFTSYMTDYHRVLQGWRSLPLDDELDEPSGDGGNSSEMMHDGRARVKPGRGGPAPIQAAQRHGTVMGIALYDPRMGRVHVYRASYEPVRDRKAKAYLSSANDHSRATHRINIIKHAGPYTCSVGEALMRKWLPIAP